jgi:hypothetical protein
METTGNTKMIIVWSQPGGGKGVILQTTSASIFEDGASVSAPQASSLLTSVCTIDNYFVLTYGNGEVYCSGIGVTTFDPLDFVQVGFRVDRGVRRGQDLVLAGPRRMSFWRNTGAADFPFERVAETSIGLLNAPALVPMTAYADGQAIETCIFPATGLNGEYAGVRLLVGYESRKISNEEVDQAIIAEPTTTSIRACTFSRHGTTFYHIQGTTFSYEFNTKTGFWHERQAADGDIAPFSCAIDFGGVTYFAPQAGGKVLWRSATDLEPSVATACTLRTSKDNGSTWTTARSKPIGGTSARSTRVKFNRLGQAREDGLQLEIKLTNAVVEADELADMTIIPPAVHSWPARATFDTLHIDTIPGVSETSTVKGVLQIAVDVRQDQT